MKAGHIEWPTGTQLDPSINNIGSPVNIDLNALQPRHDVCSHTHTQTHGKCVKFESRGTGKQRNRLCLSECCGLIATGVNPYDLFAIVPLLHPGNLGLENKFIFLFENWDNRLKLGTDVAELTVYELCQFQTDWVVIFWVVALYVTG